ncbi:hypothetical protein TNIN_29481 [Trichonephila inaurata madagascariensis]|uniref:Uncharacterized protein n=1 Tax=Trichonephila inaurata madagascariensis TaxID=2747483 RepID=A0A8X7CG68_9ARAC|nr:hypothetical protein TNIN_29481 [Trichonephila inaurata madagascariensis]
MEKNVRWPVPSSLTVHWNLFRFKRDDNTFHISFARERGDQKPLTITNTITCLETDRLVLRKNKEKAVEFHYLFKLVELFVVLIYQKGSCVYSGRKNG